jgi:hypothetical protein
MSVGMVTDDEQYVHKDLVIELYGSKENRLLFIVFKRIYRCMSTSRLVNGTADVAVVAPTTLSM